MGSCTSSDDTIDDNGIITKETTCKAIIPAKINNDIFIKCDPEIDIPNHLKFLILRRGNPDFISIHKSLHKNGTYIFKFKTINNHIISANEIHEYVYKGNIVNFILEYEFSNIKYQLILDPKIERKLLISENLKQQIILKSSYKIYYKKYNDDSTFVVTRICKIY